MLFGILHILRQNQGRNSVSLTLYVFVNAQSECGFHLKPIKGQSVCDIYKFIERFFYALIDVL